MADFLSMLLGMSPALAMGDQPEPAMPGAPRRRVPQIPPPVPGAPQMPADEILNVLSNGQATPVSPAAPLPRLNAAYDYSGYRQPEEVPIAPQQAHSQPGIFEMGDAAPWLSETASRNVAALQGRSMSSPQGILDFLNDNTRPQTFWIGSNAHWGNPQASPNAQRALHAFLAGQENTSRERAAKYAADATFGGKANQFVAEELTKLDMAEAAGKLGPQEAAAMREALRARAALMPGGGQTPPAPAPSAPTSSALEGLRAKSGIREMLGLTDPRQGLEKAQLAAYLTRLSQNQGFMSNQPQKAALVDMLGTAGIGAEDVRRLLHEGVRKYEDIPWSTRLRGVAPEMDYMGESIPLASPYKLAANAIPGGQLAAWPAASELMTQMFGGSDVRREMQARNRLSGEILKMIRDRTQPSAGTAR